MIVEFIICINIGMLWEFCVEIKCVKVYFGEFNMVLFYVRNFVLSNIVV